MADERSPVRFTINVAQPAAGEEIAQHTTVERADRMNRNEPDWESSNHQPHQSLASVIQYRLHGKEVEIDLDRLSIEELLVLQRDYQAAFERIEVVLSKQNPEKDPTVDQDWFRRANAAKRSMRYCIQRIEESIAIHHERRKQDQSHLWAFRNVANQILPAEKIDEIEAAANRLLLARRREQLDRNQDQIAGNPRVKPSSPKLE